MGLFRKIFKKVNKPVGETQSIKQISAEEFIFLPENIANMLRLQREAWYSHCVSLMRNEFPKLVILNNTLNRETDFAVNVYQLIWTCWFIAAKGYISKNRRQEFTSLLYAKLNEKHGMAKVDAAIARYLCGRDNEITKDLVFCVDLRDFMVGAEASKLDTSLVLAATLSYFSQSLFIDIAELFNDQQTVSQIKQKLGVKD